MVTGPCFIDGKKESSGNIRNGELVLRQQMENTSWRSSLHTDGRDKLAGFTGSISSADAEFSGKLF